MPMPGGNIQSLAAAQMSGKAGLIAFAVDMAGAIWAIQQNGPGGAWGSWQGPKFAGQPVGAAALAAAGQNNGELMLAMLDQVGMVWTVAQTSGGWGAWQGPGVGGQLFSFGTLAAAQQSGNHGLELWTTDLDGQIWTLWQQSPGGAWSGWQGPGFSGQTTSMAAVAAAGQNNGNLMLFAIDTNATTWAITQNSPSGGWGRWQGPSLASQPQQAFKALAAAEQGGNRGVELWTIDGNGQLWTLWQQSAGGAWSPWQGPGFGKQPAPFLRVAASGQNNGETMVLGVDEQGDLWTIAQTSPGGNWGSWNKMSGPPSTHTPAAPHRPVLHA